MNKATTSLKNNNNKGYELLKSILNDSTRFNQYASQKFKQVIGNETTRENEQPGYTYHEATRHNHLNRYTNIIPYDSNCIKLTDTRFGGRDDYINASYILAPHDIPKFYIATQGPTLATLYDFWRMVIEKSVPVIVCLTTEVEKDTIKCHRYWPMDDQQVLTLSSSSSGSGHYVQVKNIKNARTDTESNCIVRTLSVEIYNGEKELQETKRVTQLHFLGWSDHGAPNETRHVLALIKLTRQFEEENKPALVHCSAGCGRTGTFCVIDTAQHLLKTQPDLLIDPVFLLTDHFRKQRTTMVQALNQYKFCYKALKDFMDQ